MEKTYKTNQLDELLARLQNVKQTKPNQWMASCPAHDDHNPSLSIRREGNRILINCFAGCTPQEVLQAIGLTWNDLFFGEEGSGHRTKRRSRGLTLKRYAEAKRLETSFLTIACGCRDSKQGGIPQVIIPYYDTEEQIACVRKRIAMTGDKFRWRTNDGSDTWIPYGLWLLDQIKEKEGWVLLVEGESDCHTAWSHQVPALGLPGANSWQPRWKQYLTGLTVYVWREPDKGGALFVESLREDLPGALVIDPPQSIKDISAAHIDGQDIAKLIDTLRRQAIPIAQIDTQDRPELRTDMGNASRFARQNVGNLLHVFQWGWLCWDGRRWVRDETGAVMRAAKHSAATLLEDVKAIEAEARPMVADLKTAKEAHDATRVEKLEDTLEDIQARAEAAYRWALKSQGASRLRAMIALAESESPLVSQTEAFDAVPWLFNVENGTLDLRTGRLEAHDPSNRITRLAGTYWDPDAQCPRWRCFLHEIFDHNTNVIEFVQRRMGYSLSGITSEQEFVLLCGKGANGKSTMMSVLLKLMGDYAQTTRSETLLEHKSGNAIPNDIAALAGARMVVSSELPERATLKENLIKDLTGNDAITARFLRKEFFTFIPQFKLWLYGNHKPRVRGTDDGIWRRVNLVQFEQQFTGDDADPELTNKLEEELPGILVWAVEGCMAWQRDGLNVPHTVVTASREYREDQDILGAFIDECCVIKINCEAYTGDLYDTYADWAEQTGEYAVTKRRFGQKLRERGFQRDRGSGNRQLYRGIGLLAE